MKVILLKDMKKVGQRGSIVEVADGYANNVLIPKKIATPATGGNLKKVEKQKTALAEKSAFDTTMAKKLLETIDGKEVSISVKANDAGGLFESVHARHVVAAIQKEFAVSVPEDAVTLVPEVIKSLGEFRAEIVLAKQPAELKVLIISL